MSWLRGRPLKLSELSPQFEQLQWMPPNEEEPPNEEAASVFSYVVEHVVGASQ